MRKHVPNVARIASGAQVLTSVASKAIGATGVAPDLMSMALSALNDTARGSLHTESEQLTLGRVRPAVSLPLCSCGAMRTAILAKPPCFSCSMPCTSCVATQRREPY